MPELPEVQTTVNGLSKTVIGLKIMDAWSDLPKRSVSRPDYRGTIKDAAFFMKFRKLVRGQKMISVERRAKNILINLANKQTILIHMKMTGHILYGKYTFNAKKKEWLPASSETNAALHDPFNRFLHLVFTLSNNKHLVLSDVRTFAKVTLLPTGTARDTKHLSGLGPEPLEKHFDFKKFKTCIYRKPNGIIKTVLMDPSVIAGIGNIYSDEMLWLAGIHPLSRAGKIPDTALRKLFSAMRTTLKKGIDFGGDSTSDYRQIDGTPGKFSHAHNAYRMTGKPCKKKSCSGGILRKAISGRGAHFCSKHQQLFA